MGMPPQRFALPPAAAVFREGEAGDYAYLIESGRVEVSVIRDGRKLVLATLEKGDLFGELSLINNAPRSATATTLEASRLIAIGRAAFQGKLANTDPLVALFMRAVLERFHEARERLLSFAPPPTACALNKTTHDRDYQGNRRATLRELHAQGEIEDALHNDQLRVFLQPIVALNERQVAGFEALVRWAHPRKGLLSPQAFIQFAESTGQIVELGAWIFDAACRLHTQLPVSATGTMPFISVNLSMRQLSEPTLVDQITRSVERWQVNPAHIKLEITESALMGNPQQAILVLEDLHRRGFTLAIDDFGTGYSSFNYLARFPLDCLKIDKSFVDGVTTDPKSTTIIRSLAALAHALKMTVIAEGIETDAQVATLRELGCDLGQGHYFSAALPFQEARRWVAVQEPNSGDSAFSNTRR